VTLSNPLRACNICICPDDRLRTIFRMEFNETRCLKKTHSESQKYPKHYFSKIYQRFILLRLPFRGIVCNCYSPFLLNLSQVVLLIILFNSGSTRGTFRKVFKRNDCTSFTYFYLTSNPALVVFGSNKQINK
jgi:hypothetical protein